MALDPGSPCPAQRTASKKARFFARRPPPDGGGAQSLCLDCLQPLYFRPRGRAAGDLRGDLRAADLPFAGFFAAAAGRRRPPSALDPLLRSAEALVRRGAAAWALSALRPVMGARERAGAAGGVGERGAAAAPLAPAAGLLEAAAPDAGAPRLPRPKRPNRPLPRSGAW